MPCPDQHGLDAVNDSVRSTRAVQSLSTLTLLHYPCQRSLSASIPNITKENDPISHCGISEHGVQGDRQIWLSGDYTATSIRLEQNEAGLGDLVSPIFTMGSCHYTRILCFTTAAAGI